MVLRPVESHRIKRVVLYIYNRHTYDTYNTYNILLTAVTIFQSPPATPTQVNDTSLRERVDLIGWATRHLNGGIWSVCQTLFSVGVIDIDSKQ